MLAFLGSDVEADLGAAQGGFGAVEVGLGIGAVEALFGAVAGFLGACHIDFFGAFSFFRENRHLVRQDFGESPGDGDVMRVAATAVGDLTHVELGDERGVAGKNAEISVLAGDLHLFGFALHHQLLGGDDFELESVCDVNSWLQATSF